MKKTDLGVLLFWLAVGIPILLLAALVTRNLMRPDYAAQALANYPGGEERLLRDLEDPRGKSPQQAKAERELAKAFREYDEEHPDK